MRLLCVVALLGIAEFALAADEKKAESGVREIDLKGVQFAGTAGRKWGEPTKITGDVELQKAVGEQAAKGIKVDFAKEQLLLFRWAGSGQDKLTYSTETKEGKTTVTFALTPGRTKDLRQHAHLFAIPAAAEYKCGN